MKQNQCLKKQKEAKLNIYPIGLISLSENTCKHLLLQ